jgi:hypothetical protein
MVEHTRNGWTPGDKAAYLIAALNEPTAHILCGIPTGVTYEEIIAMLENHYGDHHLVDAFHAQLKKRVQHCRKSQLEFCFRRTPLVQLCLCQLNQTTSVWKRTMHSLTGYKKET